MGIIEHYERRKRDVEEDIRFAEETHGFYVGCKTADGVDRDVTEIYMERLRAARDAYGQASSI